MIYLVLGRREVGKSTLALFLAHRYPRRVIFDPRGLFPATRRHETIDDIKSAFDQMYEDAGAKRETSEIVITPLDSVSSAFDFMAQESQAWVRQHPSDRFVMLIDEARFIKDQQPSSLDWLLRCSPREIVSVIYTAHRPVDIVPDVRAISDHWLIFRMTQENDLEIIRERTSDEIASQVTRLPERHFLAWDDGRATYVKHFYPDRWYVPLRAHADQRLETHDPDARQQLDTLGGETGVDTTKLF